MPEFINKTQISEWKQFESYECVMCSVCYNIDMAMVMCLGKQISWEFICDDSIENRMGEWASESDKIYKVNHLFWERGLFFLHIDKV